MDSFYYVLGGGGERGHICSFLSILSNCVIFNFVKLFTKSRVFSIVWYHSEQQNSVVFGFRKPRQQTSGLIETVSGIICQVTSIGWENFSCNGHNKLLGPF